MKPPLLISNLLILLYLAGCLTARRRWWLTVANDGRRNIL